MSETTPFTDSSESPVHGPPRVFPWSKIAIGLVIGLVFFILVVLVQEARTDARQQTSRNNLKQIGLAIHNYHDTHHLLPPSAIVDRNGLPQHGWTYQILPYLDSYPLYNQIDGHKPWNDPANVELYKIVYPVLLNPEIAEVTREDGLSYSHYAGNTSLFKPNGSFSLEQITDGKALTIMVGEINAGFVAWGTPGNVRDPAQGLNDGPDTFGSPFEPGVQFLFADGSVRTLSHQTDRETLKAYASPAGGEKVED